MDFFKIMLGIHIVTGSTGLIVGTVVAALKKGNKLHKTLGDIFLYAMVTSASVSLYLATAHPNNFLFIIGIFTLYMSISGYRIQKLRKLNAGQKPASVDWIIIYTMLFFALAFIVIGSYGLTKGNSFGIVYIFFGLLSLFLLRQDFSVYQGKSTFALYWVASHMTKMMGAYIASITAFIVVNQGSFRFIPIIILWIGPGLIGGLLITKWQVALRRGKLKVFN